MSALSDIKREAQPSADDIHATQTVYSNGRS